MDRLPVAVGTAIADRPPHRSVRAALPHTALTLDDGVEAKFHFAHAAQPLGHGLPRSVSGSCRVPQRSPWSALFPPPPPPRQPTPLCSAGSSVLQRGPTPQRRACPACGKLPSRTAPASCGKPVRSPGSRACCFSCCILACWVLCLRRVRLSLAIVAAADVAFPPQPRGRHPNVRFSKLNHPAHQCLCLRFADRLATAKRRKTRGQDGVAAPFL